MAARCASLVPLLIVIAGCGISLKEQASSADEPDASVDPVPDAPPQASLCNNGRVVFLNFEGGKLSRVSVGQTDATRDRADWLAAGTANIPAYKAGNAARTVEIQQIVDATRQTLGAFPIRVVTERPAAGPYHLVIFGGRASQLGNGNDAGALTGYDCGNRVINNVTWIGEKFTPQDAADYVVGAIGLGIGLVGTLDVNDCMCGWGNNCVPNPASGCTLSSSIANDGACSNGASKTQDEVAAFHREFCEPLPLP
jgi:hypothetical protein